MTNAQMIRLFKRLREEYRAEFTQGESDEAFLLWCENRLHELYGFPIGLPDEDDSGRRDVCA